jgi:tRNA(fMet)-specific endonuclease VapC
MEVRVALDTNRLSDLLTGDPPLAEFLSTCDEVWIPLIVLAELEAGFHGGRRQHHNQRVLQELLSKPTVGLLCPGRSTAEYYARLFVQLRRAGTPIPANDLWIAALTVEHNLGLVTRDRHFSRIPQLVLVK